jgi:hypothetical protein
MFLTGAVSLWLMSIPILGVPLIAAAAGLIWWRRLPSSGSPAEFVVGAAVWPAIALFTAISSGAVVWLDLGHVRETFPLLISLQLALTVVPLTLAGAASQVVVTWMGFRGTQAISLTWTVYAIVAAITSLAIDLWLVGSKDASVSNAQLAEVLGLLVIVQGGLALISLYLSLAPERIVAHAVRKLNGDWLTWVVGTHGPDTMWPRPIPKDRFYTVERLMYLSAVREGEAQLLAESVAALSQRLNELGFVTTTAQGVTESRLSDETEASLDVYLNENLYSLVSDAARLRREWPLDQVIGLRKYLEGSTERAVPLTPTSSQIQGLVTPFAFTRRGWDLPGGVQFYMTVAEVAIENDLESIAATALRGFVGVMTRTLEHVPAADHAAQFSLQPSGAGITPEEFAADEFLAAHDQCFQALRALGRGATSRSAGETLRSLSSSLSSIIDRAYRLSDPRWAGWFTRKACDEGQLLVASAASQRIAAYDVPLRYGQPFVRTNAVDAAVVPIVAEAVVMALGALEDLTDSVTAFGAASLAQRLASDFPEDAADIAAALGALTRELSFDDPLMTVDATARRISNIRRSAGSARGRFEAALRQSDRSIRQAIQRRA